MPLSALLTIASRSTDHAIAWRTSFLSSGAIETFEPTYIAESQVSTMMLLNLESAVRLVISKGGKSMETWLAPVFSEATREDASATIWISSLPILGAPLKYFSFADKLMPWPCL